MLKVGLEKQIKNYRNMSGFNTDYGCSDAFIINDGHYEGPNKKWQVRKYVRKRWTFYKVTFLSFVFFFSCICSIVLMSFESSVHTIKYERTPKLSLLHTSKAGEVVNMEVFQQSNILTNRSQSNNPFYSLSFLQGRRLLQVTTDSDGISDTKTGNFTHINNNETFTTSSYDGTTEAQKKKKDLFDHDAFTTEQLENGAFTLHILGVIYMFIALAIVCDEFFVPALEVITNQFGISQDVAGATFMAAGGSAPELFTSVIGVFIAKSDVGIGTIVGSAVFNILFVIGMCAIFSHGVLVLTWWPLFRDVFFYSISLIALIFTFNDKKVFWHEALILLCIYALYVTFMKFNKKIEILVKTRLGFTLPDGISTTTTTSSAPSEHDLQQNNNTEAGGIVTQAGNSVFRQGLLHLLLKTMDPLDNSRVSDAPMRLQEMSRGSRNNSSGNGIPLELQSTPNINNIPSATEQPTHHLPPLNTDSPSNSLDIDMSFDSNNKSPVNGSVPNGSKTPTESNGSNGSVNGGTQVHSLGVATGIRSVMTSLTPVCEATLQGLNTKPQQNGHTISGVSTPDTEYTTVTTISEAGARYLCHVERDGINMVNLSVPKGRGRLNTVGSISRQDLPLDQPLDISWPSTHKQRITYILIAPILLPLWVCLPDVRKKSSQKYFPWTFLGSIIWIAIYSYLMNWWAHTIGKSIGIPDAVMGLVFLAAGTSIPDLITSVIVAKKGFGDMAVSSSVGSNIFDVTVGLPLPWFLYGCIYNIPYVVDSKGMICSIILLFSMLLIVIILIAAFKWKMNKGMGGCMFAMYLIFICLSLLLHYEYIPCPTVDISLL